MNANQIIKILADGGFHSGQSLGCRLGVSRTAIWKHISRLEKLGLKVHSVKGRGYRLAASLELLSKPLIRADLTENAAKLFGSIDIRSEVISTNDEVRAKAKGSPPSPHVCLAEMQSSGRGRRGRSWVSPYAANIYLSLAWDFPEMTGALDGLSLCVGIAVADAIAKLGVSGVGLKWPNDLIYQRRKLAGILLELEGELSGPARVIIGIGVNVAMTKAEGADIDQDWVSLVDIADTKISRNALAAEILNQLAEVLPRFQEGGFVEFHKRWHDLDVLRGNSVMLSLANTQVKGWAKGVTDIGELVIENDTGIRTYRAGEVSLRVANDSGD
ncbi:MAG: bifunctional biotin--[acetyl-CoA-carboxylase] ligase/biotin operon repressor BirA [Pseudomonadales bacterium]|nr:bifunctional biotin--[acetyl-CoA-carboxylase] ligase/biotin operon repressor BirA [Pseudomonadales bacterium]